MVTPKVSKYRKQRNLFGLKRDPNEFLIQNKNKNKNNLNIKIKNCLNIKTENYLNNKMFYNTRFLLRYAQFLTSFEI